MACRTVMSELLNFGSRVVSETIFSTFPAAVLHYSLQVCGISSIIGIIALLLHCFKYWSLLCS